MIKCGCFRFADTLKHQIIGKHPLPSLQVNIVTLSGFFLWLLIKFVLKSVHADMRSDIRLLGFMSQAVLTH